METSSCGWKRALAVDHITQAVKSIIRLCQKCLTEAAQRQQKSISATRFDVDEAKEKYLCRQFNLNRNK